MRLKHVRRLPLLATTVLLLGLLAGCGQSKVQLAWVESNRPGHFEASYATFNGSEARTVWADAGETLSLKYDVRVNKGILTISAEGPDGDLLWEVSLSEDAKDAVVLPVDRGGRYAITVRGDDSGGSFGLSWELE